MFLFEIEIGNSSFFNPRCERTSLFAVNEKAMKGNPIQHRNKEPIASDVHRLCI